MNDQQSDQPLMEGQGEEVKPQKRGITWATSFFLIIASCLGFGVIMFYSCANIGGGLFGGAFDAGMRVAQGVRSAVMEVAQVEPRVVVNNTVHFEESVAVTELALEERRTMVEREFEHSWMGSTKRITMRGTYVVKAGFDLTRPFSVIVEGARAEIYLPPARILSVEAVNVEVREMRGGLWNKVQPNDMEIEINQLNLQARAKMTEAGIRQTAEQRLRELLEEKLGDRYDFEIFIGDPPPLREPQEEPPLLPSPL
ncbi:MAG: DUF4230 domain-containing protein [Verrucomicrobiales bacterium]